MAEKGFRKAKEVERIGKEEMAKLAEKDAEAAVKGAKANRAKKAYADEFTEEDEPEDIPEELEEPEVPEKKPKEVKGRSAEEIAQDIYNQGWTAGYKHRTKQLIELLVD